MTQVQYRKSQSGSYLYKIFDGKELIQVYKAKKSYSITATDNTSLVNDAVNPDLSMASTQLEFESEMQKALHRISEINKV